MSNEINVTSIMEDSRNHRVFRKRKWNMDEAYSRLKIVRDSKKKLVEDLNECVNIIPVDCKILYEKIFDLYEELEDLEVKNIKFGE